MLASNKKVVLKIVLFVFIILTVCNINAYAVVNPTREFYINDYANLINPSTEQYIINTNLNLYNETGAQIVVVTVPNLEGKFIEEYANELYRKFGIGDKSKDNGVLMLLALEEREFRIEVGYGLEGALPDAKTGKIQDEYIIPYLSQNNWDAGIRNGFNAIIQVVAEEYGVTVNDESPMVTDSITQSSDIGNYVPLIMMGLFFVLFFIAIKNGGTVGYGGHRGYGYPRSRGHNHPGNIGYHRNGGVSGRKTSSRNNSSGSRSTSRSTRISFGGGGSSGGGGSTRKF